MTTRNHICVVSDCGFKEEIDYLIASLVESRPLKDQIMLIQLYREGCDFEGDSRSYIVPSAPIPITYITNNGSLNEFNIKIKEAINHFIYPKD